MATIVYLPHMTGYFEHRLDVVRLSFETLFENTNEPYDLLVFDNASCDEVKSYLSSLQAKGRIRYLISSSENIGKLGAMRLISGAAPGELIAYADDDTFFYPGWLREHLDIYNHFPDVGMVSGSPERTLFDHGIRTNLARASSDPEIELTYGRRIPMEWEREWATALGKNVQAYLEQVGRLEDIVLAYQGRTAYATACHNQFLSPKAVLERHLQGDWTGRLMGGLNEFDEAIDSSGLLRLTTMDRTTKLIGNVVSPEMANEARTFGVEVGRQVWQTVDRKPRGLLRRMTRRGPLRWFLQGLYNRLFWILSGQSGEWVELDTDEGVDG
ncbi:MAG: glycosyltransferase family A protein [Anaerolineales bacterium]